ncbi:MAG: isoprenylcysteine carboxylmethyltransferase family protein [Proteobacteria bacterium]|nr:isoprenylcysteine carboxylmethyltransferase family protein [Pseudomonadota bacterium]
MFRRHETNIIPYKDPENIVTSGPFRFSRHPMYLGMLLVLVGTTMLYGTVLSLVFPLAFFIIANWWYIPFEESKMADVFGDAFTVYKARVRRWL